MWELISPHPDTSKVGRPAPSLVLSGLKAMARNPNIPTFIPSPSPVGDLMKLTIFRAECFVNRNIKVEFHVEPSVADSFKSRLAQAMKAKGMNQPRLAAASGVAQGLISKYVNGRLPETDKLSSLANALGVTMNWLWTGHDPPARLSPDELPQPVVRFVGSLDQAAAAAGARTEDFRAVPLVADAVAAGSARVMSDQVEGWAWIYGPLVGRRSNLVAVRIAGDSMAPVFPPGSVVVIDRGDRRISPRGVYLVKDDGGCTVKYLELDGQELVLIPENRQYREQRVRIEDGQETPVVGRVVMSWATWAPPDPEGEPGQSAEKKARYRRGR
jgi:phage repressor protein C with HTH and peptisase S24 domain